MEVKFVNVMKIIIKMIFNVYCVILNVMGVLQPQIIAHYA